MLSETLIVHASATGDAEYYSPDGMLVAKLVAGRFIPVMTEFIIIDSVPSPPSPAPSEMDVVCPESDKRSPPEPFYSRLYPRKKNRNVRRAQ